MKKVCRKLYSSKGTILVTFLAIALVLFAVPVHATVTTLDGWTNKINNTSASPQSFTYTVSTGTNRLLLVAITTKYSATGTRTYSAAYGGKPLTMIAQYNVGRDNTWVGYLKEADIISRASNTIQVTYNGSPSNTKVFVASYQNVDQSLPITDANGTGNNNTTNSSVSFGRNITIAGGDQLFYIAHSGSATATQTPPAGYTELLEHTGNGLSVSVGHRNSTLAGSENQTVSFSASSRVSLVVVSLNDAATTTCTAVAPTVSITPPSQTVTSNSGGVTYSVTVKNNDTGTGCSNVIYTLSPSDNNATSFNTSTLSITSVTIAAGATSSAIVLNVSAKSGQTAGLDTTTVTTSASGHANGNNSVTTSINVGSSSPCISPANQIISENCNPGNPQSEWDVSGAGDSSIQGFATDISVNQGGTVYFKINTNATAYRLDIYRMGYYQGNGARFITTILPLVTLPQNQPACLTNSTTGLIDCGNWAVSASWNVPSNATSGIYFARAVRLDTGGASHVVFIVRSDASNSDILFQTSDTTWQAYNDYGGNNLYTGNGSAGRAYKVSYNRPFHTRVYEPESWVFNAEYPMVRWFEANGYDVTYSTGLDADRNGPMILNHKVWMSNGHDEYWSGTERSNVEAARAAGIHLAFFSSNTIFWKTRWESSIDGSGTPYRTLVCYKETHANALIDPQDPPTWTGTWRDPRFSPPADGGRPENALMGSIFMINGSYNDALTVPQADGRMRFWRNTSIAVLAPGQTATLAPGTLGAEVDVDLDNGFRPAGLFGLSTNNINTGSLYLQDYGSTYGAGNATHRLTLYRYSSGSLVFATGTYQWSWGLDANHDRSSFGASTDASMQQATVNLFADMGVQPAALQTGIQSAIISSDHTSPSSTITSPSAGSSLPVNSATTITGTAIDSGGGVVGGVEVSIDNGATWHPATGRESWSYTWIPTVAGSATIRSRAVDDSGNIEIPSAGVTVTVGAGGGTVCTSNCTIWPSATVPGLIDGGPDSSVELGMKFQVDSGGSITGIRFYKASTNTGTHVGNLWTSGGTLLATATFTGETVSGWQQVIFSSPVTVAANTVYVASYHASVGHYSADVNSFATKGVDSPPLHVIANGVSGGNGVYVYGSSSSFPNQTWNSANYWVDVVFSSGPPPTLSSVAVTPVSQTVSIGATQQFTATGTYSDGSTQNLTSQATWTSSNMGAATITSAGLATAISPGTTTISATLGSVIGGTNLTVQASPLTITTASLPGGTLNIAYSATMSASGGTLPYVWSSTTGTLPTGLSLNTSTGVVSGIPTASGSFSFTAQTIDSSNPKQTANRTLSIIISASTGSQIAPILIISSASNPFSSYYAEILQAEGFNEFVASDISSVSETMLASYDVVILGDLALTSAQVTMLTNWVNAGGHLVAMHPDKKLVGLLGLSDQLSTIANAYLLVNTSTGPGVGIVNQTIQYHGAADLYRPGTATNLATLFSNATTSTSYTAVSLNNVGTNGGQAAAFAFDLARSIVYTRQGNPAWSGQNRDGDSEIRSDDLFYGAKAGDVQPDWVDLNKVAIPQADEQQRLLANLIIQMNISKKPLPRFWYFPSSLAAVVVMTGDDHGNNGTAGRFDAYISMSPAGCSVENWECIRSTSYIYTSTPLTNTQASAYNVMGFEVGLHVTTNCTDWTPSQLEDFFSTQLSEWSAKYTSLPSPVTNRTHCIAWSDYVTQPIVELRHGIRLDTNYYYYPPSWVNDQPGFFTGSGMPMRFADSTGNLIDEYQAVTQMTDESGQTYPYTIDSLLDKATGPEGFYGAFTANMHTDSAASSESDAIVSSALARHIPVVSARQMLTWLDGRNSSTFSSLNWNGNTLSFSISVGQGANNLVAMAPVSNSQLVTTMTYNGNPISFTMVTIKGIQYARFLALNGDYQINYANDTTPPTVSGVSPANGATGVSIGTKVTAIFSELLDPTTITAGTFNVRDASSTLIAAAVSYDAATRTALLAPATSLVKSTTYTATVKGGANGVKDVSGNPLASDYPWSFTTSTASAGPYSIWPTTTIPTVVDSGPDSAVELGIKFRADSGGTISGIRFYKAGTNTGTHVANLWTSTGTLLATASFTNETASGWQQVSFSTPVAITANTVYVASYHTNVGHYSDNQSYFSGKGVDSPPLHALADGVSGFNGVFAYGSTSNFPSNGWNSSNYWVDIVFQP